MPFKTKIAGYLMLIALPLILIGCSRTEITREPSWINNEKIQVKEDRAVHEMSLSKLSDNYLAAVSAHYTKHGSGQGVEMSVLYDPDCCGMKASDTAAHVAAGLKKHGVDHVKANILPVKGHGKDMKVVMSYMSYTAHAPKGCGILPGYNDMNIQYDFDYKLGCTVDSMVARQVARPRDLMGVADAEDTADGRRASNIGEFYRTGIPNEPLEGESASE